MKKKMNNIIGGISRVRAIGSQSFSFDFLFIHFLHAIFYTHSFVDINSWRGGGWEWLENQFELFVSFDIIIYCQIRNIIYQIYI